MELEWIGFLANLTITVPEANLTTNITGEHGITTTLEDLPYHQLYQNLSYYYYFDDYEDFVNWYFYELNYDYDYGYDYDYDYDDRLRYARKQENQWMATISDKVVLYFVASLITIFGVSLNALAIVVFSKGKRSGVKDIRIILLNLAVVDLIWALSAPLGTATTLMKLDFPAGQHALCTAFRFFMYVGGLGSLMFTAALALERAVVVCFPLQARKIPQKNLIRFIFALLIWIALAGIYHNIIVSAKVVLANGPSYGHPVSVCIGNTRVTKYNSAVLNQTKIKYYVLISIILLCYTAIAISLTCRRQLAGRATPRYSQQNTKVLKMLFLMSVLNILYWIPSNIVMYLDWRLDYPPRPEIPRGYWYIKVPFLYLTYASTCMSPIVYLALNKDFRDDTKDLLQYCRCCVKVARIRNLSSSARTSLTNIAVREMSGIVSPRIAVINGNPRVSTTKESESSIHAIVSQTE